MGEFQPLGMLGKKLRKQIRPFADDQGIVIQVFIPTEIHEFIGGFQAIEIKVISGARAIHVGIDDAKRGTGDVGFRLQMLEKTLGPMGFPAAQIANQGKYIAGFCLGSEVRAKIHHGLW